MFINQIFITILEMSFISSIIAMVIIILRSKSKTVIPKNMVLFLWAILIIKLLIPIEIPSPLSLYNQVDVKDFITETDLTNNSKATPDTLPEEKNRNEIGLTVNNPETENTETVNSQQPVNEISFSNNLHVQTIIAIIYLSIAGIMIILFSIMYVNTYRKIRKAQKLNNELVRCIIGEYSPKNKIKICTLPNINSPLMYGVICPVIVFPHNYEFNNEKELRYILIHEVQHIRHYDNLWNIIMLFCLCVHWFNPLVWISQRLLMSDIETACDERVLNNLTDEEKTNYATTILNVANNKKKNLPALVMGFNKRKIKERIKLIMNFKKSNGLQMIISSIIIFIVILIFATGNSGEDKSVSNNSPSADNSLSEYFKQSPSRATFENAYRFPSTEKPTPTPSAKYIFTSPGTQSSEIDEKYYIFNSPMPKSSERYELAIQSHDSSDIYDIFIEVFAWNQKSYGRYSNFTIIVYSDKLLPEFPIIDMRASITAASGKLENVALFSYDIESHYQGGSSDASWYYDSTLYNGYPPYGADISYYAFEKRFFNNENIEFADNETVNFDVVLRISDDYQTFQIPAKVNVIQ